MRRMAFRRVVTILLLAGCATPSVEMQWNADQRLTIDPAASQLSFNFAWSVAADDHGGVHAVWHDTRDGNAQIYYKRRAR